MGIEVVVTDGFCWFAVLAFTQVNFFPILRQLYLTVFTILEAPARLQLPPNALVRLDSVNETATTRAIEIKTLILLFPKITEP
jgi:hypothetical protein